MRNLIILVASLVLSFLADRVQAQIPEVQDVVLVVGQIESETSPENAGASAMNKKDSAASKLADLLALNPHLRVIRSDNLESAIQLNQNQELIGPGEKVRMVVMLGSSINEAVNLADISGRPGKKAGHVLANSFSKGTYAPDVMVHVVGCNEGCRRIRSETFEEDFIQKFTGALGNGQNAVFANHINENESSKSGRFTRIRIASTRAINQFVPTPTAIRNGISVTIEKSWSLAKAAIKIGVPLYFALGFYTEAQTVVREVGVFLSFYWLAGVILPERVLQLPWVFYPFRNDIPYMRALQHLRVNYRAPNQCSLLFAP